MGRKLNFDFSRIAVMREEKQAISIRKRTRKRRNWHPFFARISTVRVWSLNSFNQSSLGKVT